MKTFALLAAAAFALLLSLPSCGGSNSGGGGGGGTAPSAPTGLVATAGSQQVALSWVASATATSYNVKRAAVSGGPYTNVAAATTTSDTDSSLTNGTKYYYVVSAVNSSGESSNSSEVSATPVAAVPATPTGLMATAGNLQVGLTWTAVSGAAKYNVKRSTTTGGLYTVVASPTAASDTDSSLTNGTKYFYVVSALNSSGGESGNSTEVSATPTGAAASVHVTVNALDNRHPISIYGGAGPKDPATVTDSGLSVVRWGGNATSTYNWKLFTYNADNDYYFEDFGLNGFGNQTDGDSVQFVTDVKAAGSAPLMTMPMLSWVAKSAEVASPPNNHWSFSIAKYHDPQCAHDPFNMDAGNGIAAGTCSNNPPTYLTADPTDAYVPLLDDTTQTCTGGQACVYRNQWAAALATAFGSSPHFYDMDNEIDIWNGTHRDIHPNATTYQELRDVYLNEARALKGWDPAAIRLGPVSCCWYYYWRSRRPGVAILRAMAASTFYPGGSMKWRGRIRWRARGRWRCSTFTRIPMRIREA